MKFSKLTGIILIVGAAFLSCESDFLDEKPNSSLVVPNTLADFDRLLDNFNTINMSPILGEVSSDDYFFPDEGTLNLMPVYIRKAYLWQPDLYEGQGQVPDWNTLYESVFVTNIVLDGLQHISKTTVNGNEWDQIKGRALFVRSYAFYNLAQLFAPPFEASTAETDLGIPVRLKPGVDEHSVLFTVKDTYGQIISDLEEAAELLPIPLFTPNRNRPNQGAAFALLARIHLSMRDYDMALAFANRSLEINDALIDFNEMDITNPLPFSNLNLEVLVQYQTFSYRMFTYNSPRTFPDNTLLELYQVGDLRKILYFDMTKAIPTIKGSYAINGAPFFGLSTGEVYLIKAECLARDGNIDGALNTLNALLVNRYAHGTFSPMTTTSADQLLESVLKERRKELVFRGIRWQDLRRLNKEGYDIRLVRNIGNQTYYLEPNSPRYVLPFPPDELILSNYSQNPKN